MFKHTPAIAESTQDGLNDMGDLLITIRTNIDRHVMHIWDYHTTDHLLLVLARKGWSILCAQEELWISIWASRLPGRITAAKATKSSPGVRKPTAKA